MQTMKVTYQPADQYEQEVPACLYSIDELINQTVRTPEQQMPLQNRQMFSIFDLET
jgi:hypothetical protein